LLISKTKYCDMKKSLIFTLMLTFSLFVNGQTQYPVIVIETNFGTMKAILYDDTPNHSAHFLKLVKQGYFNGTLFHRVVKEFMIQGGAQDSRNAPAGAQIGGGRTDMDILPEFRPHHFHKKGAIAAPRRGDDENPQKRSDASQFYVVHGKIYSPGRLDSMEMAVNVPIKNRIIRDHYLPHKDELARLKSVDASAFNALLDSVLHVVDSLYEAAPGKLTLPAEMKEAYSTIGGAHHLDGEYTVFGEVIEGLDVIDKIAALPVDANSRPRSDAKIVKIYVE